jgi:hypothetical protein
MAIDFKSKFDQLYGGAEEIVASAPELQDVAPTLVEGGESGYSSKELNQRRTAVSARHFRNPRVRSQEGAFTRTGPKQFGVPADGEWEPTPDPSAGHGFGSAKSILAKMGGGPGGSVTGTSSGDVGPEGVPGGMLGTSIGNAMAQSLGISAAKGAAPALGMGLASGVTGSSLASGVMGAAVSSALGPLGALAAIAPAAIQGQLAYSSVQNKGLAPFQEQALATQAFQQAPKNPLTMAWNVMTGQDVSAGTIGADLSGEAMGQAPSLTGGETTDVAAQMTGLQRGFQPIQATQDITPAAPTAPSSPQGIASGVATTAEDPNAYSMSTLTTKSTPTVSQEAQTGGTPGNAGGSQGMDMGPVGDPTGEHGMTGGTNAAGQGVGPGAGAGVCVVGTEMTIQNRWRRRDLAVVERWCQNTLHDKTIGEAMRRGYRWYGRKIVKLMRKSGMVAKAASWMFKKFTDDRTGRNPSITGKVIYGVGGVISALIGVFARRS